MVGLAEDNFRRTTLTTGGRIARPPMIHLSHECVKGREYGRNKARSNCDQATVELVDALYAVILFSRHFKYLFSFCWRRERLTKIRQPKLFR